MTDSSSSIRSFAPHSSACTVTSDLHNPQLQGAGNFGHTGSSHSPYGESPTISTSSVDPISSTVASTPQASVQSQRLASGRARGKSVSISVAATEPNNISLSPTNGSDHRTVVAEGSSNTLGVHRLVNQAETHTPTPTSQRPTLPRSPISPHRAKPRRGIPDDLSSETSELSSADFLLGREGSNSNPRICTAPAHADRGLHFHPSAEDEVGTGDCSSDVDSSLKTESDNGIVETESAAGSTRTEAGSSVPSDSISECSNSDVEIYLEAHGLDDSAMRMNCVGNSSFVEVTPVKQAGADSPVLPASFHVEAKAPGFQVKVQHEDNEGWVTNQHSARILDEQGAQQKTGLNKHEEALSSTAQHGEFIRLSAEGQSGNYDASLEASPTTEDKRGGQGAGSLRANSSRPQPSCDSQAVKPPRLTSDLKPTSADFKPRMGIELKPPLVEFKQSGIEFPPHATFTTGQPSTDRILVAANRDTPTQYDTNHPFQSNRAISGSDTQLQDKTSGRANDAVYLNRLQPHSNINSVPPSINEHQVLEDYSHEPEDPQQHALLDESQKTPNVYINGLPPHFPEDQLYALAAPFGEVRSVRTFTRHVRDSESGYGFVLFETIEAAERCIVALRKYRNLHPTFSKQIHKIPGTIYAQSFAQSASESMNSLSSWDSKRDETDTFKRRMESLHDPTSTNLYMEGLPLSIDEPTLAALVSPHRISSSRFFQTRLSHPPRIIAFVRLETRAGAEEIIERLHGRMVRGWNDTGSRISVRFADTTEQRELRRAERTAKDGEGSASRLTIAQAALLNLRGQELRQAAKISTLPVIGERRRHAADYSYNDFSSGSIQLPGPQTSRPVFEVDYSLAPGRAHHAQNIQSPSGIVNSSHVQQYGGAISRNVDPSMAILLDNLRGSGSSLRGPGAISYDTFGQQHNIALQSQQYVSDNYGLRSSPAHARSGYTATEEFIMRAHAESRRRPAPLDLALHARNRREHELEIASANIATGVRGYRTHAAALTLDRKAQASTLSEIEPISMVNENEFHATATRSHDDQSHMLGAAEQDPDVTVRGAPGLHNSRTSQVIRQGSRTFPTPVLPSGSQFASTTVNEQHHNQHVRSTTFPHRPTANQHQRHQQHSSMSVPNTGQRTPQHAATAVMGQSNLTHDKNDYQDSFEKQNIRRDAGNKLVKPQHASNPTLHQNAYDMDNQPSPSLISPTLTYSSQTPSTLSPATPFFGSFNSQNEGFDRNGGLDGKKLRAVGH